MAQGTFLVLGQPLPPPCLCPTLPPNTLPPDTVPPDTLPPDDLSGENDVDIILTWGGNDDLDLHVIEPSGEELYFGTPTTSTGGTLVGGDDIPDCADTGSHGEEAFWGPGQALPGTYQLYVRNFNACDQDGANIRPPGLGQR